MHSIKTLSEFLAEVVMTGHYLAEPARKSQLLHDAEMKALKIISTYGPMQMHHVADAMHATKARATQLISALESQGFVIRSSCEDHRVKMVSATPLGDNTVTEARRKYLQLATHIESKLGMRKTKQLCELLSEITPLPTVNSSVKKEKQSI